MSNEEEIIAAADREINCLNKQIERLQEQLNQANKLLLDFCSEDECRFDHNGYCQEHDSCEGEYKCIQKDLKQYLEKYGVK